MIEFEWDLHKARYNMQQHGVSFTEAATVLSDDLGVTVYDPDHSVDEDRYITIRWSQQHRLLMVSHTERGDRIRLISARELTRAEREAYEEEHHT